MKAEKAIGLKKVKYMAKWYVVAYPEYEGGCILPKRQKIIEAETREEAQNIAWRMFPEYHEVGVYRKDD